MFEPKKRRIEADSSGSSGNVESLLAASELDTRLHISSEASLKRHLKELDRKVAENSELRAKFPDDPVKFVQSECDLCEEVEMFKALAAAPELLPLFQESALTLLSLLNHQNSDIAMLVTSVLSEVTEIDVLNSLDKLGKERNEGELGTSFVKYLMDEFNIFSPLGDNLRRLNEFSIQEADDEEGVTIDEFKGVTDILNCVSNLCDAAPEQADSELLFSKNVLLWILQRIRGGDDSSQNIVDYNRQYCAEILSSLCQRNEEARKSVATEFQGMDLLLETLASFRKRESLTIHEEEFLHNVKNCLVCFLLHEPNKDQFCELEGVVLMARLLLVKVKLFHSWALELLALAVTNHLGNCNQLFKQGLGGIFSHLERKQLDTTLTDKRLRHVEQLTAILKAVAMLAQGTNQDRLIAKLFDDEGAKLKLLVGLHINSFLRLEAIGAEEGWDTAKYTTVSEISETVEAQGDERLIDEYDDKCDAGLIILQNVDMILLSLCRYGNDIVTMQVHAYLNRELAGVKLVIVWANVLSELCAVAPLSDEVRSSILTALKQQVANHDEFCKRVEAIKELAAQRAAEKAALAQSRIQAEQDEARRLRNRDRKQREKIRKYDRELERREQLEEYRYARKTGTLW
eukprot:Gregarina_sp_Poly_1__1240@NODE_1300_length_4434_cov_162_872910_g880_i0_p1_GENE_NODE_1300_length_4434_cov_162_872910_g880_i0NODE_1300_length_4434_cov_162_872910_g880_i0_p1_ORF_typecomplete_len630_score110_34CTNNBL/PF08216_11/1_3e21AAA_23/PF13476_6/0_093Fzo_mitofusin/PF04799_13/0_87Fzo_mitofusin/PF04799_13/12Fzo_mitofusin/PF04799_13/4_5e02Alpha2MRAP_C/PF06401_11/7e02Alpha2MRAP_C/PF06401_11/0_22DUF3340/PF11818_8/3_9e02DUF3340/PF11818_8/0_17HTH_20/PF12840_7/34HTH_20/PF12840_7/15DUF4407/PF14362_6/4_7